MEPIKLIKQKIICLTFNIRTFDPDPLCSVEPLRVNQRLREALVDEQGDIPNHLASSAKVKIIGASS